MSSTTFASLFGICCVLVAVVPALQGCSNASEPELTDGDLAQLATSEVILVKNGQMWQKLERLVTDQSDSTKSAAVIELQGAIGVHVFSSDVTASAVVEVDEQKLKVSLTMGPISLKEGLIALQRAEDDERGPVLVLEFPLLGGKLSPAVAAQNLLNASRAHIEGYVRVSQVFTRSFKLLMNKEGYRFYLEMQSMFFANFIEAQSTLKITDTNEARLAGEMSLKFDEELGKKIADLIRNAAQPVVDQISAAWAELEKKKDECPGCNQCGVLDLTCMSNCAVDALCKAGFDAAKIAFDLAKQAVGDAADKAAYILEHANSIFSIHSAKFDLLIDSTASANFEVTIDATVLGSRRSSAFTINLENLDDAAQKIASGFEPTLLSP
jgi:ferredoxin